MKAKTSDHELSIPKEISTVAETLKKGGFEAYLVGGCVRDLLLNLKPKDWDVATSAKPEEIIKLFTKTFYENNFGTVGVVNETATDETLKVVEVTPFRLEGEYSDFRRPDKIEWGKSLSDDLKRRDFTINALALEIEKFGAEEDSYKGKLTDLYDGQKDLTGKIIRAVGDPHERFGEDALRMLRTVRISAELGFKIENETKKAIQSHASLLEKIAKERIQTEFSRIIMSKEPMKGLLLAQELGLLKFVAPEFEVMFGVEQNKSHIYDVWEHSLRALQHAADKNYSLEIRLTALLHDIGKPESRRFSKESNDYTFYGHEVIGARIAVKFLNNLKFPKKLIDQVRALVRWHMFFSDTEQITLSAVRRMIRNVGQENIWHLMDVRICDRIGMGRPKEDPYRLRKYHAMIDEALRAPISVGMLKISGAKVMELTGEAPGPKIGFILHALLSEALENPDLNSSNHLEKRAKELALLNIKELEKLGEAGKLKKEDEEEKEIKKLRGKHKVR
ncbi:MAG: HD domain-containing protein [Candidatus Paceibacterota bacterium]